MLVLESSFGGTGALYPMVVLSLSASVCGAWCGDVFCVCFFVDGDGGGVMLGGADSEENHFLCLGSYMWILVSGIIGRIIGRGR